MQDTMSATVAVYEYCKSILGSSGRTVVGGEHSPAFSSTSTTSETSALLLEDTARELENASNREKLQVSKKTLLGMVIVAFATLLFCTVGAIVQFHGGSVLELMLGRYVTQNMLAWVIWFFRRPANCRSWYGDPPHRANIWMRGILYWLTTFCWWRGLEMVPIGDGEAILFLSPILTVMAARLYLKEELPKSFAFTLILTLAGLVFICQPSFVFADADSYEAMSWKGLLFLIGASFAWTGTCVLVRTAKSAHWLQLETVSTTQAVFIWTPLIILLNQVWWHNEGMSGGGWDFKPMSFGMMGLVGLFGFGALMFNVIGYQIGDATKVAWMEYLDLVFAFLYQWLAFGQAPNLWEWIGVACLLGTCAIHLLEEYLKYRKLKRNLNATMAGSVSEAESEQQPLLHKTTDLMGTGKYDVNDGSSVPLLQNTVVPNMIDMSALDVKRSRLKTLYERLSFGSAESTDSAASDYGMK